MNSCNLYILVSSSLVRSGLPGLPGMPLGGLPMPGGNVPGSPQALIESYKQSYGDMIKHLQG